MGLIQEMALWLNINVSKNVQMCWILNMKNFSFCFFFLVTYIKHILKMKFHQFVTSFAAQKTLQFYLKIASQTHVSFIDDSLQ